MRPFDYTIIAFATAVAASVLTACSQSAPAVEGQATAATAEPVKIEAPAGRYEVDPTHSSLSFMINHVGLSNYVARFTKFTATLDLHADGLAVSSVAVTIDPTSIRTDHSANYRASHEGSSFSSWDDELAQSPNFFNAGHHPQIEFRSTGVESSGPGAVRITGDLTLLGQTHPVTLDATLVGSTAKHPFGAGAGIGFSAKGSFKRSSFGMNYMGPPLVGDTVTVVFEGEFGSAAPRAAAPAG